MKFQGFQREFFEFVFDKKFFTKKNFFYSEEISKTFFFKKIFWCKILDSKKLFYKLFLFGKNPLKETFYPTFLSEYSLNRSDNNLIIEMIFNSPVNTKKS